MRRWTVAGGLVLALLTPVAAQQVTFGFENEFSLRETELPYRVNLGLSAVGATRVKVEALVDLTSVQARLPELLVGRPVLDLCGNRTEVTRLDVTVRDNRIAASGNVRAQFFECNRTGDTSFERGTARDALELGLDAEGSAVLEDNCIFFEITDIDVRPANPVFDAEARSRVAAARTLLADALQLVLAETPLCPDLPPELEKLDPKFESGSPREIGEGGLGVRVIGSIDVSTGTILDLLGVLQREGLVPGAP